MSYLGYLGLHNAYGRRTKTFRAPTRPRALQSRFRKPYNRARNRAARYVVPGYTRNKGFYGRYRSIGNQELKFIDTTVTTNSTTTVGNMDPSLVTIAQGVAENQRVGRKVFIKDIEIRGVLELETRPAAPGDGFIRIRIIVAVDKQCNGAAPGTNDLLQNDDVDSYYEQSNSGRFHVLHDSVMVINTLTLNNEATPEFASNARSFRFKKTCNIPIQYTGATGGITEIQSNNIFVQQIASGTGCAIHFHNRLRYTD